MKTMEKPTPAPQARILGFLYSFLFLYNNVSVLLLRCYCVDIALLSSWRLSGHGCLMLSLTQHYYAISALCSSLYSVRCFKAFRVLFNAVISSVAPRRTQQRSNVNALRSFRTPHFSFLTRSVPQKELHFTEKFRGFRNRRPRFSTKFVAFRA